MAKTRSNRSKRRVKNRARVKRLGARSKRVRSLKRKRRAKRGPR